VPSRVVTRKASDTKAASTPVPSRNTQVAYKTSVQQEGDGRVLSWWLRVWGVWQSQESGRQRVKLRNCIMWSKSSESVKHCIWDQRQGYETKVLNVWEQNYLLRMIPENLVKCAAFITVLSVLLVVSINNVIC